MTYMRKSNIDRILHLTMSRAFVRSLRLARPTVQRASARVVPWAVPRYRPAFRGEAL